MGAVPIGQEEQVPRRLRRASVRRLHPVWPAVLAAATAVLAACGAAGTGPTGSPATTGINLVTMAGPTCPVQRQGQLCEKAISARVVVRTKAGATVTTVQTGAEGTAHVALPPGVYQVAGQAGTGGFPRAPAAQSVIVSAGAFVSVRLDYDTGIR